MLRYSKKKNDVFLNGQTVKQFNRLNGTDFYRRKLQEIRICSCNCNLILYYCAENKTNKNIMLIGTQYSTLMSIDLISQLLRLVFNVNYVLLNNY